MISKSFVTLPFQFVFSFFDHCSQVGSSIHPVNKRSVKPFCSYLKTIRSEANKIKVSEIGKFNFIFYIIDKNSIKKFDFAGKS